VETNERCGKFPASAFVGPPAAPDGCDVLRADLAIERG
jgi:hypothetical protein